MAENEISYKINIIGTPFKHITELINQSTTLTSIIDVNDQSKYTTAIQVIKEHEKVFKLHYTYWRTLQVQKEADLQDKQEFYNNNNGVMLVYDYGNRKSFDDLQDWIERNRMIYGRRFSYTDALVHMTLGSKDKKVIEAPRPYLTQYINDQCKDKTVIKCRQSEFTENEVNENIWLSATIPYFNVRHIFPTGGMALKIAKEKISPSMESSPNIKRLIKHPTALQSKEFKGYLSMAKKK